jgi:hypothetical protein
MIRNVIFSAIAFVVGCAAPSDDQRTIVSSTLVAVPVGTVSGYGHTFERSLFKPGGSVSSISHMGFAKFVGSDGVFATDEVNGWVLATPNAGSPLTTRPPFSVNADDHNAKVLAYFLGAGIPKDQIRNVDVHAEMHGGMSATGVRTKDQLVGFCSILNRAINGFLVAESTAYATFNVDGDVVEESVYWPELPGYVVADAAALATMSADPKQQSAFLQKVEAAYQGYGRPDGQIVIHHGDSTYHGAQFAVATYDTLPPRGGQPVLHFDGSGQRVVLPHELSPGNSSNRR